MLKAVLFSKRRGFHVSTGAFITRYYSVTGEGYAACVTINKHRGPFCHGCQGIDCKHIDKAKEVDAVEHDDNAPIAEY